MSLTIRRAAPKDAAAYACILSDPSVYPGLLQVPFVDETIMAARLAEMCAPGKADLPLVAEVNGAIVGSAGLHPVGPALRRRHVLSLGMSVLGSAQGQGIGTALMAALCGYADRWAGALRLELTVFTDNEIAMRLYRKFGFEVEGTFKGYALRDGRYVDVHPMARWHPDPPPLPGT